MEQSDVIRVAYKLHTTFLFQVEDPVYYCILHTNLYRLWHYSLAFDKCINLTIQLSSTLSTAYGFNTLQNKIICSLINSQVIQKWNNIQGVLFEIICLLYRVYATWYIMLYCRRLFRLNNYLLLKHFYQNPLSKDFFVIPTLYIKCIWCLVCTIVHLKNGFEVHRWCILNKILRYLSLIKNNNNLFPEKIHKFVI